MKVTKAGGKSKDKRAHVQIHQSSIHTEYSKIFTHNIINTYSENMIVLVPVYMYYY